MKQHFHATPLAALNRTLHPNLLPNLLPTCSPSCSPLCYQALPCTVHPVALLSHVPTPRLRDDLRRTHLPKVIRCRKEGGVRRAAPASDDGTCLKHLKQALGNVNTCLEGACDARKTAADVWEMLHKLGNCNTNLEAATQIRRLQHPLGSCHALWKLQDAFGSCSIVLEVAGPARKLQRPYGSCSSRMEAAA